MWNVIEKTVYSVLKRVLALFHKELTDDRFSFYMQFVKFGIVGLSNTLISYLLYTGSLLVFRRMQFLPVADYIAAQIVAFVLGVLWAFYWNDKKVFVLQEGEKRSLIKSLLKTYVSYSITGVFLNSILLVLWIQVFHISEFLAPLINVVIGVPINFLINKFWAFKKNE